MLASKAVELEVRIRYFDNYKLFLYDTFGNDYSKWPRVMLFQNQPADFCEMGKFAVIAGYGKKGNRYIRRYFLKYAKERMFKENILPEDEIFRQLSCIYKIRTEYRNLAAHFQKFSGLIAQECLQYIVEDDKVLLLNNFPKT